MVQSRVLAIARKEFLHIVYDFRTLFILFLMPVMQLVMFGYAMNMEIEQVNMAVVDRSGTPGSRELVEGFRASRFFRPFSFEGSREEMEGLFQDRRAHVVMVVPVEFDRKLVREGAVPVQFLIDASDANTAMLVRNYCSRVLEAFNEGRRSRVFAAPFEMRPAVLFNPDLKSSYFFVPGVIAMILVMISALLTSVAIAREKETGTLEQILVSPVRAYEIILGKVLPYLVLAFLDAVLILGVGLLIFGVPFRGDALLLAGLTLLYIFSALSLGLMISTRVKSQQVAMMAALVATLLPTMMLSGMIFPIASMPELLQYVTCVIPARYYLLIVRGILLKGSSLGQLVAPTLSLAVMVLVLLVVSVRRFGTDLET